MAKALKTEHDEEEEQNKTEYIKTHLKVVISKQVLSIIVGHIFVILEDRNKWNLKCKEKNWLTSISKL